MNKFMTILKLIVVIFAILTAGLLIVRVFGGITTQELKDNLLKIALVTGIITALCAIVIAVTTGNGIGSKK